MPQCPICGSEYQSNIDHCSDCGHPCTSEVSKSTSDEKKEHIIPTVAGLVLISVSAPYLAYFLIALTLNVISETQQKLAATMAILDVLVVMMGCFLYGYAYGKSLSKNHANSCYMPITVSHIVVMAILMICGLIHNGAGLIIMTPVFIMFSSLSLLVINCGSRLRQRRTL